MLDDELRQRAHRARTQLRAGTLDGAALFELLLALPPLVRDAWTDELLGLPSPPPDEPLPRGSVPYMPCGVAEILAAIREAPIAAHDTLVDLGSGLGRVAILARLLTGARAIGIELQAPLVAASRALCADLAIDRVDFIHADVTTTPLDGSIYFLYAPFNGEMLARALAQLEAVARRHPITICAVDLQLDAPWLSRRPSSNVALTLYDARATVRA